jgi:hypothetical protein
MQKEEFNLIEENKEIKNLLLDFLSEFEEDSPFDYLIGKAVGILILTAAKRFQAQDSGLTAMSAAGIVRDCLKEQYERIDKQINAFTQSFH